MAYVVNNRVFLTLSEAQEYITESDFGVTPGIIEITDPEQIRRILDPTRFVIGPGFDDQDIFKQLNTGASRLEDTTGIWQRIFTQMGRSDLLETGGELLQILLETTKAGQPGAPIDESQLRTLTQEQREAALEAYLIFNQSFDRAQEIVDTMIDNPAALEGMEDPGEVTNLIIEQNALGLLGPSAATPVTSVPQGMVIRGGAGVTVDISEIGSISDVNLETIFEHLKGYIPGISLPSWLPSAGVIFIPDIQGKIRQVNDAIGGVVDSIGDVLTGEASVQDVLDAMGGVITDVFDAVVYNTSEEGEEGIFENAVSSVFGAIKDVLEGTADATTTGTVVGGVITSVLGSSLPTWLPGVLTTVFGSGSPVLPTIQRVLSEAGIELPLTQEIEQDPTLMFTHRGDNYFVNKTEDEYFQLAESEDIDFEFNGQYTREQLEDTGLETINSGTYQSLLDDLSFHALEEDIYQYSMEDLIARYEEEGGVLPSNWKLMDEESQYNFFLDDYFDIPPLIEDPDKDSNEDSDDDTDDDTDTDTGTDQDVTSIVEGLFADFLAQLDEEFTGQIQQAINDAISNLDIPEGATPEEVRQLIEEAVSNIPNLSDDDVRNIIDSFDFATFEEVQAGFDDLNTKIDDAVNGLSVQLTEQEAAFLEELTGVEASVLQQLAATEGGLRSELETLGFNLTEFQSDVATRFNEFQDTFTAFQEDVSGQFADLNERFDDAINGIATQFSDQEAEFLASITGLEASLIQSLAAVEGGLSAELEMLGTDLISLQEDVANRFDEFQQFTSEQFGLAADERRQLQEALIAANGDISQLSLDMQQQFEAFGGTINELFAGVGVDIEALRQGQITSDEALASFRAYTTEQFEAAANERLSLAEELINVNGQVTALSEDSQRRFEELGLSLTDLQNEFNVNFLALQEGQIDRDEAFAQFRDNITGRLDLAEDEREEILTRLEESERIYGEQQEELQQQILAGNVISALSAGGMFAPPAASRTVPFKDYLETFTYAPSVKPLQVQKTQVPPQIDYVQEATRLALGKPAPTRKKGMLA